MNKTNKTVSSCRNGTKDTLEGCVLWVLVTSVCDKVIKLGLVCGWLAKNTACNQCHSAAYV